MRYDEGGTEGERVRTTPSQHQDGLLKVGGQEEDQKITCRRTVEKERNKAGWKSWEAQVRKCWSGSVETLWAYWRDET